MESLALVVTVILLAALGTSVTAQLLASSRRRFLRSIAVFSALVSGLIGANLLLAEGRPRLIGAALTANAVLALFRTLARKPEQKDSDKGA